MDLLEIVSTVLELSQNRENYGDEISSLKDILIILQTNLRRLSAEQMKNLPEPLHDRIKGETEKSHQLLKSLPSRPGVFSVLASKLPGSSLSQLKDQKDKLCEISNLLSHTLIIDMLPKQQQLAVPQISAPVQLANTLVETDFVPTLYDPQIQNASSDEDDPVVQLTLKVEENVKQVFRKYQINEEEICHLKFVQDVCEVFKFQRSYFAKMQNDIEAIKFISRDHAVIKCSRIKKEVSQKQQDKSIGKKNDNFMKPIPKQQNVKDKPLQKEFQQKDNNQNHKDSQLQKEIQDEIFHSLDINPVDELFMTCQEFHEDNNLANISTVAKTKSIWQYKFELVNLGQMGTFVQKSSQNLAQINRKNNGTLTWSRIQGNETIELNDGDQIAIQMQKPHYKTPLISYVFYVQQQ